MVPRNPGTGKRRPLELVFAEPDDRRLTIEPDIPVEVTAADFFSGHGPALEAALAGD